MAKKRKSKCLHRQIKIKKAKKPKGLLLTSRNNLAEEHVLDGGLAAGVEGGHGAVEEAERRGDPPQLAPLLVAQPVDHHVQVDVKSGNCYNKSNE